MNTRSLASSGIHTKLAVMLALSPVIGLAQTPVDDSGNPIGEYQPQDLGPGSDDFDNFEFNDEGFIATSPAELEDLVGSIALYPDDLLAIILPASTYPLQLVEASRFLAELESNPSLQPACQKFGGGVVFAWSKNHITVSADLDSFTTTGITPVHKHTSICDTLFVFDHVQHNTHVPSTNTVIF